MSKEITRFCPTICNGQMHVGHILNYMVNMLYAQQNNGHCYFAPEAPFFLGPGVTSALVVENLKISENFGMIDGRNVCLPLLSNGVKSGCDWEGAISSAQNPYIRHILENINVIPKSEDKDEGFASGEFFEVALNDFIIGVTTIIRGRDLSEEYQKNIHTIFAQSKHEMWLDYFNKKSGKEIKVKRYFHPLLLYHNNKISKSQETPGSPTLKNIIINTHSFLHEAKTNFGGNVMLLENEEEVTCNRAEVIDYINGKSSKIMPSSIVLYVMELMAGKVFTTSLEANNFYKEFNIDQICQGEDYTYDFDDLVSVDLRLRKMLCDENAIHTDDPKLIKAERNFIHQLLGFKNWWGIGDYWHHKEIK